MKATDVTKVYSLVDSLGMLQAQIADLEKQEKDLKAKIANEGVGAYEGSVFRATVSVYERETLNMAAAKAKLLDEGFHAFVKKNTKVTQVTSVSCVAKNGENIAA